MLHRMLLVVCLLATLGTVATPVSAQEAVTDSAVQAPPTLTEQYNAQSAPSLTGSVLPSLTRIAVSLLVIIAIIYLTVFVLRKLSGNRLGGGKKGRTVQVVEQTYLAPKKSVCLLKLADRAVLVGVTDSTISFLTEFDWDSLPQEGSEKSALSQKGFPGLLKEAVTRFSRRENKGELHGPQA
jgi:flagellar biosynthetic protein FliO